MNKDNEVKQLAYDQTVALRERVDHAIKRIRDEGEEIKERIAKTLIPTGYEKNLKDDQKS